MAASTTGACVLAVGNDPMLLVGEMVCVAGGISDVGDEVIVSSTRVSVKEVVVVMEGVIEETRLGSGICDSCEGGVVGLISWVIRVGDPVEGPGEVCLTVLGARDMGAAVLGANAGATVGANVVGIWVGARVFGIWVGAEVVGSGGRVTLGTTVGADVEGADVVRAGGRVTTLGFEVSSASCLIHPPSQVCPVQFPITNGFSRLPLQSKDTRNPESPLHIAHWHSCIMTASLSSSVLVSCAPSH
jgi:hypothetical protein